MTIDATDEQDVVQIIVDLSCLSVCLPMIFWIIQKQTCNQNELLSPNVISSVWQKEQRRTKKKEVLTALCPCRAQFPPLEFHKNAEPNSQLFVCWLSAVALQTGGVTVAPVSSQRYASTPWHIMIDGQITCPGGLSGAQLLKHPTHLRRNCAVSLNLDSRTKSLLPFFWLSVFLFLSAHPECWNKDKKWARCCLGGGSVVLWKLFSEPHRESRPVVLR